MIFRRRSRTLVFFLHHAMIVAVTVVQAFRSFSSSQRRSSQAGMSLHKTATTTTASYLDGLAKTWAPSSPFPTTKTPPGQNSRYPSFTFEKYLENPYFHHINTAYPGLQLIQEEPFIFVINDFLSPDECARLKNKADQGGLRPQVGGGMVERTSTGVVCTKDEVPTIQQKMMDLIHIHDLRKLQYLKVSKYQQGQTFSKHTDAWPTEGAPISKGWVNAQDFFGDEIRKTVGCLPALVQPNHNTLLTVFVYLNDVTKGGCTVFPNIGLHTGRNDLNFYTHPSPMDSRQRQDGSPWDWEFRAASEPLKIVPQQGMAVLHFCSLLPEHGGITDGNCFHIAEPPAPGMEKYVSQQFVSSCTEWTLPEDSLPIGRVTWDNI